MIPELLTSKDDRGIDPKELSDHNINGYNKRSPELPRIGQRRVITDPGQCAPGPFIVIGDAV